MCGRFTLKADIETIPCETRFSSSRNNAAL